MEYSLDCRRTFILRVHNFTFVLLSFSFEFIILAAFSFPVWIKIKYPKYAHL